MNVEAPALVRAFVASHPIPAVAVDADLVVRAHNDEWLAAYLPGRESVEGERLDVLFPWMDPTWREVVADALAGRPTSRRRYTYETPDGPLTLRWTASPWHVGEKVAGAIVVSEDITEEVKREGRLEESLALIRAFFDRSPVGLNLCRMDGTWVESNDAFLHTIGYSDEEANGLTYWELTPRTYDDEEKVQLAHLQNTGRYGPYEKEFVRKDGRLVPVRLSGFLVEQGGETFIWSIIEDLTDQHALAERLEEERTKALRAARLSTVGEMAAGFAHEVNNPLAIIGAWASELKESDGTDPELVREAAAEIAEAVDRAGTIVGGLGKLSRPQLDAHRRQSFDGAVDEAVGLCRHRLRGQSLDARVELTSSSDVTVHPVELLQVVVNLINNACDAALEAPEPWIGIATRRVGDAVELDVSDSGPGVDPETRGRLFDPFFTTKPVGKGTGLGLSISHGIVEAMGGTLDLLDDAPHTTFRLRIPAS